MSGFLRRLAARAIGAEKPVRPRAGLLFPPVRNEVWPGSDDAQVAQEFQQDRDVDDGRQPRARDVVQPGPAAVSETAQTDRAVGLRQSTVKPLEMPHDASMRAVRNREPVRFKAPRTPDAGGDAPEPRVESIPAVEPPAATLGRRTTGSPAAQTRAERASIANDRREPRSGQDDARQTERVGSLTRSSEAERFEARERRAPRGDVSPADPKSAPARSEEPRIRISIGRVEVRVPAAPQRVERSAKVAAPLSLDEYLKELAGRRQ